MEATLLQGINERTGRNKKYKILNQESVVTLQKKVVTVGYTTRTCVTYARKFNPLRANKNEEKDEINDNCGFLQAEDVQDTVVKRKRAMEVLKSFCQKTIYSMIS